ncbi:hypothetical protein TELCIR_15930 [Teladorsagia circumcincta]|uniref:gamma-glutamylcyclotransferase n=1 Tax=Teladorsagia circumcincta TaxID=45464 RepID=A0A2G9TZ58_TELCI|nr:hypothetical protein TELCIR_15930 [Teladorsagia circumcincta]
MVHGCVWRVPDEFAGELDLQESGYHRLNVPVQCADKIIECRTYQYSNSIAPPAPPSPHYKTVIVAGAIEHSLPESYIKGLKEIPDNGYKGRVAVDIDVHGCVWRVPDEFAGELDLQESGYHRLNVPVQCADKIIECRTYQYSNSTAPPAPPSPHYKTVIVAGAIEHSLPESYIKGLKEIPDNGYKGRVAVDIDVIKHLNQ